MQCGNVFFYVLWWESLSWRMCSVNLSGCTLLWMHWTGVEIGLLSQWGDHCKSVCLSSLGLCDWIKHSMSVWNICPTLFRVLVLLFPEEDTDLRWKCLFWVKEEPGAGFFFLSASVSWDCLIFFCELQNEYCEAK